MKTKYTPSCCPHSQPKLPTSPRTVNSVTWGLGCIVSTQQPTFVLSLGLWWMAVGDWDILGDFCFPQAEVVPMLREMSTGICLASWPPFNYPLNVYINEVLLPDLAGLVQGSRLMLRWSWKAVATTS